MFLQEWQFWTAIVGVLSTLISGVAILWRLSLKTTQKFDLIDRLAAAQDRHEALQTIRHGENKQAMAAMSGEVRDIREDQIRIKAKLGME